MFGKNDIYNFKSFSNLEPDQLLVSSMFYSIQGEGPFMGKPAFFIRLAGCHRCCEFCDTYFDTGDILTFGQIKNQFYEKIGKIPELIVITGGEPFLQKNIYSFITGMQSIGVKFQFETTGDIKIDVKKFLLSDYTIVISPKITNECYKLFDNLDNIKEIPNHKMFFKFIVSADPKSPYHTLPFCITNTSVHRDRVYISPMTVYLTNPDTHSKKNSFWVEGLIDKQQMRFNHEYAAELCLKNNFNLSLQMQLYCSLH